MAAGPTDPPPPIFRPWFDRTEHLARLERLQRALRGAGHEACLLFQPESVTWLTGFFTRGYASFQCAIVPVEGAPCIVCRDMEAYYLEATSAFSDAMFWSDTDDPVQVAARAIRSRLGDRPRLAVEMEAWPLSPARLRALRAALPGAQWRDAGGVPARLRLIKSPAELALQRSAGRAAEAGMRAALEIAAAGVSERDIAAVICAAMIRAGSDLPGPGVLSSGERALHLHGGYADRVLQPGDMLQIEVTPAVRHYHARFMRPIRIGPPRDGDAELVDRLVAIQDAALAEVRPGVPATRPDAICRDGILRGGLQPRYSNKTFYSVGLMLAPTGGEPLEATPAAEWSFEPGMVFHSYLLVRGFGMSETVAVTATGIERLTQFERGLFLR